MDSTIGVAFATPEVRDPDALLHAADVAMYQGKRVAALAAKQVARRKGVPFILEIRDLWPQTLIDMGMSPRDPAVLLFGWIERHLYRNADKIVTLLPAAGEYMVPEGARERKISLGSPMALISN